MQQQQHNTISQPHAASEQLATQQQGISQLAQHSATVLNIPAICDSKIQIDATTLSLCTNPEQSSSPQTLPDEMLVQQQLTKLEKMCAQMQDENEKLIREASQYKTEQIRQVLELGEEADKLSSMKDYHAAELCYLHALNILPEHAQSLCNYAHLLHTGKKELDKAEELFKKALQAEPHRAPTLFNYAAYQTWTSFPGCSAANPTCTDNV